MYSVYHQKINYTKKSNGLHNAFVIAFEFLQNVYKKERVNSSLLLLMTLVFSFLKATFRKLFLISMGSLRACEEFPNSHVKFI